MDRPLRHMTIPRDVIDQAMQGAPRGAFRYSSIEFARDQLPPPMMELVQRLICLREGFPAFRIQRNANQSPPITTAPCGIRVSYHLGTLLPGQSAFGNKDWHKDGKGDPGERHTLMVHTNPHLHTTQFRPQDPLAPLALPSAWSVGAGEPVTYPGHLEHRMAEVPFEHERLVIRVSSTWMRVRDHWTQWGGKNAG